MSGERNVSTVPIVARNVTKVAKRVARSHEGYTSTEDLIQEGWLWVMAHEKKVWENLDDEDFTTKAFDRWIYARLRTHMHRYCIKQRTLSDGTQPGDYYVYTSAVIEALLPDAFDTEPLPGGSSHDVNVMRGRRAPNEGNEYITMVADIQQALQHLDDADYQYINMRYADGGLSTEVMAVHYEVTQRAVRFRLNSIVRKMQKFLDGDKKKQRRYSKSNASAIASTSRMEDGSF